MYFVDNDDTPPPAWLKKKPSIVEPTQSQSLALSTTIGSTFSDDSIAPAGQLGSCYLHTTLHSRYSDHSQGQEGDA